METNDEDLLNEIWKPIAALHNKYEASTFGRIRNTKTLHIKTIIFDGNYCKFGYDYSVNKVRYKGWYRVHRAIAETFLPNPDNLPQVNHKDENKTNNNVWNLEWCSRKYNMNYGTMRERGARKIGKAVQCIETGITYWCANEAERQTGIWATHIREACKNNKRTAGGYHWQNVM